MSFPVTTTTGLRVTGLSIARSAFTSGMFLAFYCKSASGRVRGINLYDSTATDGDGSTPSMAMGSYPATRSPYMRSKRAGGSTFEAYHTASDYPDAAWTLIWGKWDSSTGDKTVGFDDMAGSTSSGPADWETSSAAPVTAIGVGLWRSLDNTGDEFGDISAKIALPFIVKRLPTSGELTDLVSGGGGGGGKHPLAVFGEDLLDYWPVDSKTSAINGWVLSDVGGTITIDTGDNPTVDDPPAGGSAVPVLMNHYRRMRA
jgi:hypothetical protein